MKHVFIIDPKSFRDVQWRMDSLIDNIGQYFRTQERSNFSTLFSHYPRDAMGLIQKQAQEAEEEYETLRVYAVGGDDILFDCLNGIVGIPDAELVVMPYGNTNNFIRSFGDGKAELFKDIQAAAEGPSIPTDMIRVGYNYAINGCAVGLTPAIAMKMRDIAGRLTARLGRFSRGLWLFLSNVTTLLDYATLNRRYTITIDEQDFSGNYSQIYIMNGPYFGRGKHALAGVSLEDGFMNVVLFKSVPLLSALNAFGKYTRGSMPSNCVCLQAKKITIKSDTPMKIQTDSVLLQETSINLELVPGGVPIVAVHNLRYQGSEK